MDKALVCKDVSFHKGDNVIFSGINLEITRGEIVSICGSPSGNLSFFEKLLLRNTAPFDSFSGETTLDAAELELLNEQDLRYLRMVNIAVLSEPDSIGSLNMTVQKYISLPFRDSIKKTAREIMLDAKRIMELLGIKNTEKILNKKFSALSQAQQRAVIYAAALSTDPAVALCYADIRLTEAEKDDFFTILIKICKIKNISLLLLTTDLSFARKYGENTYILDGEKIEPFSENASYSYLDNAATMEPFEKPAPEKDYIIRASHLRPRRKDEKIDFTLYKKEMIALACENGPDIFTGKATAFHGGVYVGSKKLQTQKNFISSIMHISESFPFLPVTTTGEGLKAFAARPSWQENLGIILDALPLPTHFLQRPFMGGTLFETLYLGLVCAAVSQAKLILLSDIDRLLSNGEKYELLLLLSAICERTGAGAIVFSDDEKVYRCISSKIQGYEKEETTERMSSYADAT